MNSEGQNERYNDTFGDLRISKNDQLQIQDLMKVTIVRYENLARSRKNRGKAKILGGFLDLKTLTEVIIILCVLKDSRDFLGSAEIIRYVKEFVNERNCAIK